jgi:hypothetical protein
VWAPPACRTPRSARTIVGGDGARARRDAHRGSSGGGGGDNVGGRKRGGGKRSGGKRLPRGLLRRFAAKPQFWLMLLAVGTYTPIYEYGTFVSNYLKQLEIGRDSPASGAATALHCIENQAWLTLTLTLSLSLTLTPTLTLTCTASRTRRARRAWRSTS